MGAAWLNLWVKTDSFKVPGHSQVAICWPSAEARPRPDRNRKCHRFCSDHHGTWYPTLWAFTLGGSSGCVVRISTQSKNHLLQSYGHASSNEFGSLSSRSSNTPHRTVEAVVAQQCSQCQSQWGRRSAHVCSMSRFVELSKSVSIQEQDQLYACSQWSLWTFGASIASGVRARQDMCRTRRQVRFSFLETYWKSTSKIFLLTLLTQSFCQTLNSMPLTFKVPYLTDPDRCLSLSRNLVSDAITFLLLAATHLTQTDNLPSLEVVVLWQSLPAAGNPLPSRADPQLQKTMQDTISTSQSGFWK